MDTSSVQDSAGIQLISHPASVLAAVPEWTIDTGVHQWTIGGGEDPATEISGIYCAQRLADGRILLCHARPNEIRLYNPATGGLQRFGRSGSGPGEFESIWILGVRGDTLLFWDHTLTRLTRFTIAGEMLDVRSFATLPRDLTRGVTGLVSPDRLVSMAPTFGNMGAPPGADGGPKAASDGSRREMPVFLIKVDASGADSLAGHPYIQEYAGSYREGGRTYQSMRGYHLDGPSGMQVYDGKFVVAEPDEPILITRAADGRVLREVRLAMARRTMTPELQERWLAAESTGMANNQPQFLADMMQSYREGRFVDELAPFERMLPGPDDELWLEETWLRFDPVKRYLVVDSAGMVTGRVTIPMTRTLYWVGTDAALVGWRDADDLRHLSLHPLHRATVPR